jgi:predicted amidophosphoribosyltransferase
VMTSASTTASTTAEIARELQHTGAARVEVRVVARTPRPADR